MADIQTTGGLFTDESRKIINANICRVFDCEEEDIEELVPVQAGMTNVVLSFKLNGGKYVYRHPGLGSEALVDETDGIKKCNIHGDARDVNFLINKEEIYLIDWEYGGYGDPGFDIGSYVCGGQHTLADVDRILFTYYRHKPTDIQRRHFYAYIAITGWFFMHWTMLKQSKGQVVGIHKEQWYHFAKNFSLIALPMYGQAVNENQYATAMEAAKTCALEDLSFMNEGIGEEVEP